MKEDELLLKAFDWYYEEGIHLTNISNEDALLLFKETDTYKDYFNKANEAEQSASNCNSQCVSARTLDFASCAALARTMPVDQAIQAIKSDITGLPQTAVIDGELVVGMCVNYKNIKL